MAAHYANREAICCIEYLLGDIGAKIPHYLSIAIIFLPLLCITMSIVIPLFKLLDH
jgi:hypothetical protein